MKKSIVLAGISVLAFLSCTHEDKMFVKDADSEIVTIYASAEGVPEVRNVIDDGSLSITWTSGDAINVFFALTFTVPPFCFLPPAAASAAAAFASATALA